MSKTPVARWIVTPDKHVPYHDRAAWNCVKKAISIIRPDGYVDLGDFVEGEGVSAWQWSRRKRPPLEYQIKYLIDPEVKVVNEVMDEMDAVLDKAKVKTRVFCQGNHDFWYDMFVEENPYLPQYGFAKMMRLKERGYIFKELHEMYQIGKLNCYHGSLCKASINHARWHCMHMGANVLYGHNHSIEEASVSHLNGPIAAWSIGCLKSFKHEHGNEWLKRRPISWGHAFAVVDVWDGGNFSVNINRIIDGKCSVNGKMIDGSKK